MRDDRSLPFAERAYGNYRSEMEDLKKIDGQLGGTEMGDIEGYREPLSFDERREINDPFVMGRAE